jgi:lipoate-protein ligase A
MQLDWQMLLRAEEASESYTGIRFYRWERPTVSVGKHQQEDEAVNLAYCNERGVPIVHRPTGGRAVFHSDEITYAVVSNDRMTFPIQSIRQTYTLLAEALQRSMLILGIPVELSKGKLSNSRLSGRQKPCFVTPSRSELLCRGRKLVGSAQRRLRRSFLQHGSIALSIDYGEMGRVLGFSEELLRHSTISLNEAADRSVLFEEAALALEEGFRETLARISHKFV